VRSDARTASIRPCALPVTRYAQPDSLSRLWSRAGDTPDATLAEKADFVWHNLTRTEVWQAYSSEVVMYVLFAALGTFGLIRQLGQARRA
jgi:hypothetical protein